MSLVIDRYCFFWHIFPNAHQPQQQQALLVSLPFIMSAFYIIYIGMNLMYE